MCLLSIFIAELCPPPPHPEREGGGYFSIDCRQASLFQEWDEHELKRILSRELANDFPATARNGDFTFTTPLPPGHSPRVVLRTFRCGPYVWRAILVLNERLAYGAS